MKIVKPHFWYNKSQRNGVLFLIVIISALQVIHSFVDFENKETYFSDKEMAVLEAKVDALKTLEKEKRKPKKYPFNPNYLTDYKASQLGMSIQEIDRLLQFRKNKKFIHSIEDFQRVTKISDSLLTQITPYIKFPSWIKQTSKKKKTKPVNFAVKSTRISTSNLNLATFQDFQTIEGVDYYLAKRIVKYREKIQGFTYKNQLHEVWKLDKATVDKIFTVFKIIDKPAIKKINVNTATFKQVLSIPYIDYNLCKRIFEFRDEVAELQSIAELKNIEGFPLDKYARIVLYLDAK